MKKNALTLTVVANMTSNYSEGLGNIASVQKVFKNRKVYTIRSRESLKNAVMVQAGMYDDLQTEVDGATQKLVAPELNAATCRALEGGYMSTKGTTYVRKSSVYFTDAIACESFVNETRFHNNLYLAGNYAKAQGKNIQNDAVQLFNLIAKHTQKRPDLYIGKEYGKKMKTNYPFAAFFGIYDYFEKYGLYFEEKIHIKPNAGKK